MTTDRATGIEATGPTDDESTDLIAQLIRRVDALETENDRLHEELDEIDTRHRESCHALARENHDLRESNEQLEERIGKAEEKDGYLLDDIVDLEDQLATLEDRSHSSTQHTDGAEPPSNHSQLTPIERVSMLDTEDVCIDITPSIERAVTIFDHWEEWSRKTPKGRVLKDGLKTLLRTATDETLAWRQVYRAAEALDELSKGSIQFIHHSRHGKILIEPATENRDCQVSSAATT